MKRKLYLALLVSALILSGCSITSESPSTTELTSETLETDSVEEIQEEVLTKTTADEVFKKDTVDVNAVDKFVELYNSNSETPITGLIDIDIHDESSGYYRTEFRTAAYDNAIAKHGILGENVSIDLIQYSRGFRIYILADSYEALQKTLETTVKIYDSSITDAIIQSDIYDQIDFVGSGVSFYTNNITGYYEILNRKTGSCSVMLDTSPIGFME